jgi:hypothetical protein
MGKQRDTKSFASTSFKCTDKELKFIMDTKDLAK